MNKVFNNYYDFFICFQSSSFLWTLPNREPPVYFFGTIHVPYTRVWDYVPWSAKRAFERADSVFFELDLTDPETVAQLASCQMLPSGEIRFRFIIFFLSKVILLLILKQDTESSPVSALVVVAYVGIKKKCPFLRNASLFLYTHCAFTSLKRKHPLNTLE